VGFDDKISVQKKLTVLHRIAAATESIVVNRDRDIVFQHGIFCQVALPRCRQEGCIFERSFKNASVLIEAGKIWNGTKWIEQPIPYGPKPRLILIHINSEAVRTQKPEIEVGRSCAEFLRMIGLQDQDGRTYRLFKEQMTALAASRIVLGFNSGEKAVTLDTKPISEFQAWITNDGNIGRSLLWPGQLTLSQPYFVSLKNHAVPLDREALHALAHSSLALDIYCWLARRLHTIDKPVKVTFAQLMEQFGQEYSGEYASSNFRRKFLEMLKQVCEVYPAAQVSHIMGGLLLKNSPPPVIHRMLKNGTLF
jgi:hypothetical protein